MSTPRRPRGRVERRATASNLLGAALLAWALPGCPLSDHYYLEATAGRAGAATTTGGSGPFAGMPGAGLSVAGTDATGGRAAAGGSAGSGTGTGGDGGTAGTGIGGTAGTAATTAGTAGTGGSDTGGTGGSDAGGAPDAGATGCMSTPEVCDGVSNDCDTDIDEGGVCPAGCTAQQYGGHVYVLCLSTDTAEGLPWADASTRCEGLGSELGVSIGFELSFVESAEENAFLKDWIMTSAPRTGFVWIGANDIATEGTWVWGQAADAVEFFQGTASTGGPVDGRYNGFGTGRPLALTASGEDCGAFDDAANWDWNDVRCTDPAVGFLCEETP